jgi:ATP-binding cassette, subfamily G (WHITE), member 2, PDR
VLVLYEGRQIYFGPRGEAKKYFTDMGYHCPERQTTADFLTSMTNPSERVARPGYERAVPRTSEEFADLWKLSLERAQLLRDITDFECKSPVNGLAQEKLKAVQKARQAPLT